MLRFGVSDPTRVVEKRRTAVRIQRRVLLNCPLSVVLFRRESGWGRGYVDLYTVGGRDRSPYLKDRHHNS